MKNIVSISVLMTLFFSVAHAADLKIGVVYVERILSEAPQVEAVNESMKNKFGDRGSELQELGKKLQTMQENYKRNELVMTEDKLNELKNKIIGSMQVLRQKEATLKKEMQNIRTQEFSTLQQSIREIINSIAKDGSYDLILSDGVVFAKDSFDISDVVLKKMKQSFKAEKK